MIPLVGAVSLNLAFGVAILAIVTMYLFIRNQDYRFFLAGKNMVLAVSALSIIATIGLVIELFASNFNIDFVAHYTSRETPLLYKFTALWAGQSGSLLFWLCVLSIFVIIVVLQNQRRLNHLMPWVLIILSIVQLFFLLLTNYVTNPFKPADVDFVIANGNGLNPLLQNLTMAIHPPTLYLGYIGFTIPFAFAIAALITKDVSSLWIRTVRRWSLVSWFFLSIGIILGGWWAYQELGWGGYWAWDPVENASFMPWLTGTAFIHSILIQEKKNLLKVWNMIIIIVTFALVIFGTFLTRSGVMSSVHSFAKSSLGPIFLMFVFVILIFGIGLVIYRIPILKSRNRIESFTSRESGFLFNNVLFIVICFVVFWGTIFPVISEAVRGTKITVGAPFFNKIITPVGFILLILTGIGPLLSWRRTSKQSFINNFSIPLIFLFMTAIVMIIMKMEISVVIPFALASFVSIAIIIEFYRAVNARRSKLNESVLKALYKIFRINGSRYGGYISHLGFVFMFVGFTGHAFDQNKEFGIKVGDSDHLAGYQFELKSIEEKEFPNYYTWIAGVRVTDMENNFITNLNPEKRVYFHKSPDPDRRQPHSELDIYSLINKDIYSVFTGIDHKEEVYYFKMMINPLVGWVWIGGYLLIIGSMIALWPRRR